MNCFVYLVISGGKEYVGVSNNIESRMKAHQRGDFPVGRSMRKYGWKVEILYTGSRTDCYEKERYYIAQRSTLSPAGWNLTPGGLGCPDPLEITKQSISVTLKDRFSDETTKSEMVDRLTKSRQSEEFKMKHSEAMKKAYANGWTKKRRAAHVDGL